MSTIGSMETDAARLPWTDSRPLEPNPGRSQGVNSAMKRHPIAIRTAARAVGPPPERIELRSCQRLTGPQAATRRSPSPNMMARPAARKTNM